MIPQVGEETDIVVAEGRSLRGCLVTYGAQSFRYRLSFSSYIVYTVISE